MTSAAEQATDDTDEPMKQEYNDDEDEVDFNLGGNSGANAHNSYDQSGDSPADFGSGKATAKEEG